MPWVYALPWFFYAFRTRGARVIIEEFLNNNHETSVPILLRRRVFFVNITYDLSSIYRPKILPLCVDISHSYKIYRQKCGRLPLHKIKICKIKINGKRDNLLLFRYFKKCIHETFHCRFRSNKIVKFFFPRTRKTQHV